MTLLFRLVIAVGIVLAMLWGVLASASTAFLYGSIFTGLAALAALAMWITKEE